MFRKTATAFLAALVLGAAALTAASAAPRPTQNVPAHGYSQEPLSDSIKDRTGQGGF